MKTTETPTGVARRIECFANPCPGCSNCDQLRRSSSVEEAAHRLRVAPIGQVRRA